MQNWATRMKNEDSQNKDLINSISALINTRSREFRSETITMTNKNGDQPVSLKDRESYYQDLETYNLPKGEKGKIADTHSDVLYDFMVLNLSCLYAHMYVCEISNFVHYT